MQSSTKKDDFKSLRAIYTIAEKTVSALTSYDLKLGVQREDWSRVVNDVAQGG